MIKIILNKIKWLKKNFSTTIKSTHYRNLVSRMHPIVKKYIKMIANEKNIELAKNEIQLLTDDKEKVQALKELDKEWINFDFCGYSSEEESTSKKVQEQKEVKPKRKEIKKPSKRITEEEDDTIEVNNTIKAKEPKQKEEAKQKEKQEEKQEETKEYVSDEEKVRDSSHDPINTKSEYTSEDIIINSAYKLAKEERKNDNIKELEAFSEKERLEREKEKELEQKKAMEVKQINTDKFKIKKPSKIVKEEEPIPELIITELEPIKIPTPTPAPAPAPAPAPVPISTSTYVDSVFADNQRQKSKEDKTESTLKRDLRRAADANTDLQKEINLLKEENNKLKLKETSQADEIAELKRLLSEQQKYKIYYDKMHTNTDAFEVFLNEFYIKSASRSNRIKCSIIYDKYILETKKAISKQTFYERIENLGFPKVIVNGERCFSNILSKPTETFS